MRDTGRTIGARLLGDGRCSFRVWAPAAERVELRLHGDDRRLPMRAAERGYHELVAEAVAPGERYSFLLDGDLERPDPASRHQPEGVHGPSAVVADQSPGPDGAWAGLPLRELVLYELHVGTFSAAGSFAGVERELAYLRELGVTAIELMPVAQFPGQRNWGYDGVYPFAVQHSYGGPEGLRRLVAAAHGAGLAVVLDVVMNHFGPEGNYLRDFAPYFTDRYRTPWGEGLNFDDRGSDEVRRFFLELALQWLDEYRLDGLRLDAFDTIVDPSARPFQRELAELVDALAERRGRHLHAIAESDANDVRYVRPRDLGGHGLGAQWADDLHHALHALLTGERSGYYADFGEPQALAEALRDPFVLHGQRSAHRERRHGSDAAGVPSKRFVVAAQNHDQVGNRMLGERLSALIEPAQLRLAAGVVLLAPYLPLLFMGEEYGETAPFLYFVSHGDPELVEAVRSGRAEEFAAFAWQGEPPDPQDEDTFRRSRLDASLRGREGHAQLLALYRALLRLRRELPALTGEPRDRGRVVEDPASGTLAVLRPGGEDTADVLCAYAFGEQPGRVRLAAPAGEWRALLESEDAAYGGAGARLGGVG